MIILYGIKNCDTVKKARKWLDDMGVPYRFHDFRKDRLDEAVAKRFEAAMGYEALLNTRGTTWRKLADIDKTDMTSAKAVALMLLHDAIIKRPVWEKDGDYRLGFAAGEQETLRQWIEG